VFLCCRASCPRLKNLILSERVTIRNHGLSRSGV
jgi:hypothetical protein